MATHIRENTSTSTVVEAVDGIAAAVGADPQTLHLAPSWTALVTRGDDLAHRIELARRTLRRARAVVAVRDSIWDAWIKQVDREMLATSGGHRDHSSYAVFFGDASANDATRWGIDREVEFGRALLAKMGPEATSPVASRYAPRTRELTEALATANDARKEALRAIGPLLGEQLLYIEDVNAEIDRLEGQLQVLFPREPKRVASYLSATKREETTVADVSIAPAGGEAGIPGGSGGSA
jgi:hypothetical protein